MATSIATSGMLLLLLLLTTVYTKVIRIDKGGHSILWDDDDDKTPSRGSTRQQLRTLDLYVKSKVKSLEALQANTFETVQAIGDRIEELKNSVRTFRYELIRTNNPLIEQMIKLEKGIQTLSETVEKKIAQNCINPPPVAVTYPQPEAVTETAKGDTTATPWINEEDKGTEGTIELTTACTEERPQVITVQNGDVFNLTSPNYPGPYPNNSLCSWLIKPKMDEDIHISMDDMMIEIENHCYYDNLVMYERRRNGYGRRYMYGPFCGTEHEHITATGNLRIDFKTDDSFTERGFRLGVTVSRH